MRMPNDGLSARRLTLTFGLYLYARLRRHPILKPILDLWTALQGKLLGAMTAVETALKDRVIARADLDFADILLDKMIAKLAAAVKFDLGGTIDHPEFKKLFRHLPSVVASMSFLEEIAEVLHLAGEVAKGAIFKTAKAMLPELEAARIAMDKALTDYKAARTKHQDAMSAEDDAELDWRHGYRGTYGSVVEAFPADKRLQESFFQREREDAEPESAETTAPEKTE